MHAKITSTDLLSKLELQARQLLHCIIRSDLLRRHFPSLGADIKFIDGYVAGALDDKGVTAEEMVGFETNGGNCLLTSTCLLRPIHT